MKRRLRAGIIGLGVGESHIAGYESAGCEVAAICDFDPKRLAEAARRHPGKAAYSKAGAILRDASIDVVSIASYDNYHCDQVCEALKRGKHVFVEKPLCLNAHEAVDVRRALGYNKRLKLSSNLILRMAPRFRKLRERIARGMFGTVYYTEGDYNYGRMHKITEGWRGRIPYYSVVCGGGVHMIDLLMWLTGAEAEEVSAYGTRIATRGTRFRHEDCVAALIRLKKHGIAKVTSNYSSVTPHRHLVSVYGTRATFENGYEKEALVFSAREASAKAAPGAYPAARKGDMVPSFVRWVRGEGKPEVSTEDVFKALSVCFAIDESAKKGKPMKVRYL